MEKTPRLSAYAMNVRKKKVIQDKHIDKSQSESEGSSTSYIKETTKRKISIEENPVNTKETKAVVRRRGRKKKIQHTATVVQKEKEFNQQTFDAVEAISNGNHIFTNEQDVVVKKKRRKETEDAIEPEEDKNSESTGFSPASSSKVQTVECGNETANEAFHWLLNPKTPEYFYRKHWDKLPLFVKRSNSNYYKGLFSTKEFDTIMKENDLSYDGHIDVLKYVDGERQTVQNDMKVNPAFVWNKYKEGNSIRMRNPQSYYKPLGSLCSLLQEYFSSYVGANMYLTPAGTQGFPPHYDDIDAFILQIEGKKLWKLYEPRDEKEILARYSSADMTEDEMGELYMEVELNPGDMLYFPRGVIHQAKAASDAHSLHLTISTNQLNTYGDFLKAGLSNALEEAMQDDIEFRRSIPKDYFCFVGTTYADNDSIKRKVFEKKVMELASKTLNYFSVDYAADIHAVEFIHGSMPPFFNKREKICSIHGNGPRFANGQAIVTANLTFQTKVRFIRKRAFRLVMDENGPRLFYTLENSRNHKEKDPLYLDVDFDAVPVINALFKSYPNFVTIRSLPHDPDTKLQLAQELYDNGFLMTEEPLPCEE